MLLALTAAGCAHLPMPRAAEELDHSGRLSASINSSAIPSFQNSVLTVEGEGHTDFEGGEPYSGGLLLSLAPSSSRSVVQDIPFAIDPRLFARAQQCISFGCLSVEINGMPHVFGIPVLGLWYGAAGNGALILTLARSGHVGGHLRIDLMGGADRVTWLGDSWTALTFSPSAGAGITGRAGGVVFGVDATLSRYLATRAKGELSSNSAENLLLLSVTVGLDEDMASASEN
ncbi:MAG: hypothetical protein ACJ790_05220 [Myxococcaceae bacterium]